MYYKILITVTSLAFISGISTYIYYENVNAKHYSFTVEGEEVGNYQTYKECLHDESDYLYVRSKLPSDTNDKTTTCSWK